MATHYDDILNKLRERIIQKHEEYGTSYLDRPFRWLRNRLQGELNEMDGELFSIHLSGENAITEALDVAVCALLIADKKNREEAEP